VLVLMEIEARLQFQHRFGPLFYGLKKLRLSVTASLFLCGINSVRGARLFARSWRATCACRLRDTPDVDPGSSLASAGFALLLFFFREVTREVMVSPCEVTEL
jgi:hypothetical protein